MAIHNLVINYAQLKQAPQIAIDRNTGIPINGYVVVKTIRADRFIDDGNDSPIKEDYPIIFTTDPAILQEMQTWSKNDMVEIKGTFATRKINKSQTCPKCGTMITGKFCPECGEPKPEPKKEEPVQEEVKEETKKCPKCGAEVTGRFCTECGTKIEE